MGLLSEDHLTVDGFELFVDEVGPRLRDSLGAMFGVEIGRDAAAEALAYGWEHWDRVRGMGNPVGYLFVVGRDRARAQFRSKPPVLAEVAVERTPMVEPGLPAALLQLSDKQRTVVMLRHCYAWTMSEVAEVLGVSKSAVQVHERRGMRRLRSQLGVPE